MNMRRIVIIGISILLIAGATVWWLMSTNNSPTSENTAENNTSETPMSEPINIPGFKYVVNKPASWTYGECGDTSTYVLFLAPTQEELGLCNSEEGGVVSISATPGDNRYPTSNLQTDEGVEFISETNITIDSQDALKVVYRLTDLDNKMTVYSFYDDLDTYTITYQQKPGASDQSEVVEHIVSTFKRNSL
jgi:hypothetical protein